MVETNLHTSYSRCHSQLSNKQLRFYQQHKRGRYTEKPFFKRLLDTYLDDEPLYTIQLKRRHPNFTVRGNFYISQNDFAIHKIEYAVYDEKKRNADEN